MKLERSVSRKGHDEPAGTKRGPRQTLCVSFLLALGLSTTVVCLAQSVNSHDLIKTDLADLMNMEVTSVSKKEQKLSKVPAAIYVITQEDIRRSGATNIPDLLRMVPGLDVAQIDQNAWAITSRGFNDQFANKLLVLIDGRTVYDPAFSGVMWGDQIVPMADIERIEVIRGPGAAVWGANAVNGVINILTKRARATQGGLVEAGGGNQTAQGLIQYGGKARNGAYRVFSDYSNYDNLSSSLGGHGVDGRHFLHGGFRSDWNLSSRDSFTVEGDLINSQAGQTTAGITSLAPPVNGFINDPVKAAGGDVLGRWTRTLANGSETALQVYFNDIDHTFLGVRATEPTLDLDFQHHWTPGPRHDVVWGVEYRFTADELLPGPATSINPARRTYSLFSGFAQDEIALSRSLSLTLGAKLENNAFTGNELQPTGSLLWSPSDHQAVWVSVARAVRQPARTDTDVRFEAAAVPGPGGIPIVETLFGNPKLQSEELLANEAGYRLEAGRSLSLDLDTFYNIYDDLRTTEPQAPFFEAKPVPHLVAPVVYDSKMHGHTYGAEVSATWSALDRWQLSAGYSWLRMILHSNPSSLDTGSTAAAGYGPQHQFQVRSDLTLPRNFDFDTSLYYVGRLPTMSVPAYTRVDTRLAWRLGESTELSIVGQNLLSPRHLEWSMEADPVVPTEPARSVYGKITYRF